MNKEDNDIVGIVMFNDDITNAHFVGSILMNEFKMEKDDAVALVKRVHECGYGIIETLPRSEALRQLKEAQAVTEKFGQPLVLRIVDDPESISQADAPKRGQLVPNRVLAWVVRALLFVAVAFSVIWVINQ